jgi:hypothetical protein
LPHDLGPGQAVTLRALLRAPANPGSYRIAWDLQVGADLWLSQQGVLPRVETLQVVRSLPTPATPLPPSPTATDVPAGGLLFVADTSISDGTVVAPGRRFLKGWLVYNSGKEGWRAGWRLSSVAGRPFGARTISLPVTHTCRSANVLVWMRAPGRPGRYSGAWQAVTPSGERFGDRLTVVIRVETGPPVGTATPVPPPHPTVTPTATPVG